jgi:2-polyprenyl-6-methoxyphenol hydroxylase-like FAD-dependent oxidoreductase
MGANQRSAEIAGGGLGGMFVATALAQRGWQVRIHEKSDELRMFGAGIWLWENGLHALESIGVLPYIMDTEPEHLTDSEARDHKGRLMRGRRTSATDRLVVPRRIDLYNALIAGARDAGVEIVTGSRVTGATQDGELHLADGSTVQADLVIVADGVYSKARDSLKLTASVTESQLGAIRLLIPRLPDETRHDVIEYWKRDRCLMFNPVNPTTVYLCFVCGVDDHRGKAIPLDKESWKQSHPNLASAIDRVGSDGRWDVFTSVRCTAWHRGRAAIVGDAAHSLPPSVGQAANLTFANCLALASYVSSDSNLERALTNWERAARPITDHTQLWSERYMTLAGLCPPSMETLRSYALRVITSVPPVAGALRKPMHTRPAVPSPHPAPGPVSSSVMHHDLAAHVSD